MLLSYDHRPQVYYTYYSQNVSKDDTYDSVIMIIAMFSPFILAFGYVIYKTIQTKRLEQKLFPTDSATSDTSKAKAYSWLAAHLMIADKRSSQAKANYIRHQFNTYFPKADFTPGKYIEEIQRRELHLEHVCKWIHSKFSLKERSQLLFFLVGLVYVDGHLLSTEHLMLQKIQELIGIPPIELNRAFAAHRQKRQQQEQQRQKRSQTHTRITSKSAKELACNVLGVSEYASLDEIKKAYRKLVKLHHPDRYTGKSEEQLKIAQERFIEIQKAYELLTS